MSTRHTRSIFIQKIVSGGQTGVDQAALDVAINLGIDCSGWCPPGRLCENGSIPLRYPLEVTPFDKSDRAPGVPRSLRTEWNVRDTDATLLRLPKDLKGDKGSDWTIQCAWNHRKPILIIDPFEENAITEITLWLTSITVRALNIAGPSEGSCPGIGEQAKKLLFATFS